MPICKPCCAVHYNWTSYHFIHTCIVSDFDKKANFSVIVWVNEFVMADILYDFVYSNPIAGFYNCIGCARRDFFAYP